MKNTVRAHRNGGQKPAISQPQNQPAPAAAPAAPSDADEFALPDGDEGHPSCLCIYDRQGRGLVSKIPLTETEFTELMATCIQVGETPAQTVAAAVRRELAWMRGPMPSLATLGDDLVEARGLLQTLLMAYDNTLRESSGRYETESTSAEAFFFVRAVNRIQERLMTDWNQLQAMFHPAAAQGASEGKAVAA